MALTFHPKPGMVLMCDFKRVFKTLCQVISQSDMFLQSSVKMYCQL